MIEYLPTMCYTLGSTPSTEREREREWEREKKEEEEEEGWVNTEELFLTEEDLRYKTTNATCVSGVSLFAVKNITGTTIKIWMFGN